MQGHRHAITSADGTRIGLLTAGTGPPLLLVHGSMGRLERWAPLWALLVEHWQVTAMENRGRGSSGDAGAVPAGEGIRRRGRGRHEPGGRQRPPG